MLTSTHNARLPPAGTLDLLRSWRAFKPLQQLRRLVLANNPSLGRRAAVPGAAGAAARPSGECLGPADVLWLGKRLLRTALLELLDLRGTGGLNMWWWWWVWHSGWAG